MRVRLRVPRLGRGNEVLVGAGRGVYPGSGSRTRSNSVWLAPSPKSLTSCSLVEMAEAREMLEAAKVGSVNHPAIGGDIGSPANDDAVGGAHLGGRAHE